jgi:hypothetical protein
VIDALAVALQGAGQLPLLYATDGLIGQAPIPPMPPVHNSGGYGYYMTHHRAAKKVIDWVTIEDEEMLSIAKAFVDNILGKY